MNHAPVVPRARLGRLTLTRTRLIDRAADRYLAIQARLVRRLPAAAEDRGDVPGWVMVTLMTAGLVLTLWAVAGPRLDGVFNDAMDRVVGGP